MSKHLLIAGADADLRRQVELSVHVLWPDCTVATAEDGLTALRHAAAWRPDLAIIDVMMPPPDGLTVCRRLRRAYPRLPILLLTARDAMLDEVRSLECGADGYLIKPFDQLKLLSYLRALLRRAEPTEADAIHVDFDAREVRVGDTVIDLTPTEYLLLELLARHAGEIVSHRTLLEHVWGRDYISDTQYLKVFVNRLRHKLGDDAAHPHFIETRRSAGYRLITTPRSNDPPEENPPAAAG